MTTLLNLCSGAGILLSIIPNCLSWRLHLQNDDRQLSSDKRHQIESKIQELAQKLGINKPVELIEKKGLSTVAQAQGTSLFSGRAGIAIDPEIAAILPEGQLEFLIAHELSHIKSNDVIRFGTASIPGVITTFAMSLLFPSSTTLFPLTIITCTGITSPAAAVGLAASGIAFSVLSKWREEHADKLGLSVCSENAKETAFRFFATIHTAQILQRDQGEGSYLSKLWDKLLITEDGEARFDVLHPSLQSRIEYLRPQEHPFLQLPPTGQH